MTTTSQVNDLLPNHLIIGDERVRKTSGEVHEHVNPATGRVQQHLPLAGPAEIDRAVDVARAAFAEWRLWAPAERRRVLERYTQLLRRDTDLFRTVCTLENGIPIGQTPMFLSWGFDWLEYAAGWADKIFGDVAPADSGNVLNYYTPEPCGVVASLAAWNGSVGALGMAVGPALAVGCTVVVKPSEVSPFGMLRAAELALEAGIPAGVLNMVPGGADAGEALVSHPGIDKISFTGSGPTAQRIATAAAKNLTPCLFELGGKSASLVFSDADLERAVTSSLGLTFNAGQACTLGSRILVQSGVYNQFMETFTGYVTAIKQGDPLQEDTQMGPVINEASANRIMAMIERARDYGDIITGGERLGGELADGFFVAPTVVSGIDNSTEIARTEVFGPVVGVIPFEDEDEAIALANDTEFGLAAYVHTRDLQRTHRVAGALDAGTIGVNGGTAPAAATMPFGGRKQSGYGRQGGLPGMYEFLNPKSLSIRLD